MPTPFSHAFLFSCTYAEIIAIQISTIVVSAIGGTTLFYKTGNTCYLGGALMMAVIAPYTRFLLYPINDRLLGIRKHGQGRDDSSVEEMLIRWDIAELWCYGLDVIRIIDWEIQDNCMKEVKEENCKLENLAEIAVGSHTSRAAFHVE